MVELDAVDAPAQSKENKSVDSVSVLDCIEKFSQMEQLEEKEQLWYAMNSFVFENRRTLIAVHRT